MSGWAAAAQAGAELANTLYSARQTTDLSKQARQFASDTNVINRARDDTRMQRARADAEAAGLHPLFALGSAGAGSSSISMAPTPTGSFAGTGIARAGEAIADEIRARPRRARQGRLDAASQELHALAVRSAKGKIALDDAELMKRQSDLKFAEQRNLYWGSGDTGLSSGGSSLMEQVLPYTSRQGIPVDQRPIVQSARQSHPETVESVSRSGERLQLLNPDLGLDEVGQAEYLRLKAIGWTSRQLTAWAARRRRIVKQRKRRVRRADPDFYGGS